MIPKLALKPESPKKLIFISALFTFLLYLPTLSFDFVNWDDVPYVLENRVIQNINFENIKTMFNPRLTEQDAFPEYHPIRDLSLALDYEIFQGRPFGFHFTNILIHSLNVILFFFFLAAFIKSPYVCLVTSIVFAIHPVHVESVAWVSSRKDVLGFFFFLLSGLLFLKWHFKKSKTYLLSLLFFILALLSKSPTVTLPVVLFCILSWETRSLKQALSSFKPLLPFIAIMALYVSLFLFLQFSGNSVSTLYNLGFEPNFAAILQTFFRYTGLSLIPINISPYYDLKHELKEINTLFFLSLIFALSTIALCFYFWKKKSKTGLFLLLFVLQLLPVLNLLPHPIWLANRYLYFASPFLYAALIFALGEKAKAWPRLSLLTLGIFIFLLSFLTMQQMSNWQNSKTLWKATLRNYPNSFTAHANLGMAFAKEEDFRRAKKHLNRAQKVRPNQEMVLMNLAMIATHEGDFANAEAKLELLEKMNHRSFRFFLLKGNLAIKKGLGNEALSNYQKAIQKSPKFAEIYYNQAKAYEMVGNLNQALKSLKTCLELQPRLALCRHKMAKIYATAFGRFDLAEPQLIKTLQDHPTFLPALYDLGVLYAHTNRSKMAVEVFKEVLKINPNHSLAKEALISLKK
jgi:tetratricopeptide (TPR) repeat protein